MPTKIIFQIRKNRTNLKQFNNIIYVLKTAFLWLNKEKFVHNEKRL